MIKIIDWNCAMEVHYGEFNPDEDMIKLEKALKIIRKQKIQEIKTNKKGLTKEERENLCQDLPWIELKIEKYFETDSYDFISPINQMLMSCYSFLDKKENKIKFPSSIQETLEDMLQKLSEIERMDKDDLQHKPSKENFLENLGITEDCAQYLSSIDNAIYKLKHIKDGKSAIHVFSYGKEIIKADILEKAKKEYGFLSLNLGEANKYVAPTKGDSVYNIQNVGFFRLEDVRYHPHGQTLSGIVNFDKHIMYILGLLHKEGTRAVKESNFNLPLDSFLLNGNDYLDCLEIGRSKMLPNEAMSRITIEKNLERQLSNKFLEAKEYLVSVAEDVIMNDCKAENEGKNIINGHLIDFGSVKWGVATEDIVKYAISKKYNQHQLKYLINSYIKLRSIHDKNFRDSPQKIYLLQKSINPAIIKESLRFAASMIKRDLINPSHIKQRDYYINLSSMGSLG